MSSSNIKTRILIISDTHCAPLEPPSDDYDGSGTARFPPYKTPFYDGSGTAPFPPFKAPLPKADLLIHCGDLTYTGKMEEYHQTLAMLKSIDAPIKLVIAGNHDLSLDRDFVMGHLGQSKRSEQQGDLEWKEARGLWTTPNGRAQIEKITFLDEGIHTIDLLNGARLNIYASPYTPEFYDWGFPYERDEDRYNTPLTCLQGAKNIAPYPVPDHSAQAPIDIMITHGPPYGRLDTTNHGEFAGCPHLLRALMRCRPLIHCFGHIHEGWGAETVQWSPEADHAATVATSIAEWKAGGWKAGVLARNGIEPVQVDLQAAKDNHAVFLDLSSDGKGLEKGQQTTLINAAIMTVGYEPANAPWVIDIETERDSS